MKLFTPLFLLLFITSCKTLETVYQSMGMAVGGKPTQGEVVQGLKQALGVGSGTVINQTSLRDGFLRNQLIKILMPPQLKKAEQTLRKLKMDSLVDNVIVSMNRAAERASGQALQIFKNAITGMSFQDAMQILLSQKKDAATHYFKTMTGKKLHKAFKPIIKKSLDHVQATRYWGDLVSHYNQIPFVKKVRLDLSEYVSNAAQEGIFKLLAKEEGKIRDNPLKRTTGLLKKVFSYADSKK